MCSFMEEPQVPIFRSHTVFEIARSMKVFLNLEIGVTRSGKPGIQPTDRPPARNLKKARRRAKKSVPGENPPKFFLVGRAKSGTSWLMRLLNSHPEILCLGEGKFFGKDSPRSLYGAFTRAKELQTWLGSNPWTSHYRKLPPQDLVKLAVNHLMKEKLRKTDKKIIGDKTPLMSEEIIREIAEICADAKVVHIVRDGRDVAVSSVHHRWNNATDRGGPFKLTSEEKTKREAYHVDPDAFVARGESIFGEGHAAAVAREWSAKVGWVVQDGSALLDDNYHQVHYEDLLAEPVEEVRRLLEFLGADSSEEVARACVEAASFEKMSGRNPGEEDSSSFFRKGVSGDWRNVFNEEDRQAFKEEAGELLVRLGYENDNDW